MRAHHPVLQTAQFLVAVFFTLDAIHENLTQWRGYGCQATFDAGGQGIPYLVEAFGYQAAGQVDIRVIFEVDNDDAQRIFGCGA